MKLLPYNPIHVNTYGLGCARFARRYSGHRKNLLLERNGARHHRSFLSMMQSIRSKRKFRLLLSLPPGTEMFHFPGSAPSYKGHKPALMGFPHSEISGSKVDWHLTETYRSHSTSFIASYSQGIHHTPLHSCKECCTPLYI